MVFILQDEISQIANIFIDDLPIKGPALCYPDKFRRPETLPESGATFSAKTTQICLPKVVIIGQKCMPQGRLPDDEKVSKIKNWPPLTITKEVRGFLGLCGTVRIWIKGYSQLAQPLTEL